MDARYFGNCCSKGKRAFLPYTSHWPESQWFGPVDQRQDQWAAALDPTRYLSARYVCWNDARGSWGCVSAAPNAYTLGYLQQRQRIDREQPFGAPSGYPVAEPAKGPCECGS